MIIRSYLLIEWILNLQIVLNLESIMWIVQ